jgi:hypothetical protein
MSSQQEILELAQEVTQQINKSEMAMKPFRAGTARRRRRRRYRRRKGPLAKLQRQVSVLTKSQEIQHQKTPHTNSGLRTTDGWQIYKFAIGQGTSEGSRLGNSVYLRKLWIKGLAKTVTATARTSVVRFIIGWAMDHDSLVTGNFPNDGTEQALYTHLDRYTGASTTHAPLKIYKDVRFNVGNQYSQSRKYFEFYVNLFKVMRFYGSTSSWTVGGPFLAVHVDQDDASGVNIDWSHVLTFIP